MMTTHPGRPRSGQELGRGSEGVVYENLDEPGWVLKEFFRPGTLQAKNEYDNLAAARRIRSDNVVAARHPLNPRQGWIVKERVYPANAPGDLTQKAAVLRDFANIHDAQGNLMWGTTVSNATPRWILIE